MKDGAHTGRMPHLEVHRGCQQCLQASTATELGHLRTLLETARQDATQPSPQSCQGKPWQAYVALMRARPVAP